MVQLKTVPKKEFFQKLKEQVEKKKISQGEVFSALENSHKSQIITEYKKSDYSKLTKEDWKKVCETFEKDRNYQKEAKLWDNIDDE